MYDDAGPGAAVQRDARRDRAAVIAAARLCVVPLSCAAAFAADDPVLSDNAYGVVAVLAQVYAAVIWVLNRSERTLPSRIVAPLDVGVVLALALVADPHESVAGRLPLILLFITWSLMLRPSAIVVRGVLIATVVVGAELVEHEAGHAVRLAVFIAVVVAICTTVADRVTIRLGRLDAVARRAEALQADADDLERRERTRIAQLLHDDALQRLLAARQDLEGAGTDVEALKQVAAGLAEATAALRNLTLVVHDDALEAAGFEAAVQRIVQDAASRASLEVEVDVDPSIDGEIGSALLPMLRELVTNVERHAAATRLRVEVRSNSSIVTLLVEDDGVGIRQAALAEAARSGHLGHVGLRRRVEDLSGTLRIDTRLGEGTAVTVRLQPAAIAARRAVEETLRHEREWNATLVAGFPDPFVVIDDELRVLEVSDRFLSLTGWSRADLLGAPPGALPHLNAAELPEIRAVMLAREKWVDYSFEGEVQRRDGRLLQVIISVRWVRDPRGGRALRLATFKDISERQRVERALRSERDLSMAIRTAMQEPFLQTHEGVVIAVNEAFCALTGYTEAELIGAVRPYFFIRTARMGEAFTYAARLDAEGLAEADLLALRSDGEEIPIHVRGVTVRDEDGVAIGRVQTVHPLQALPPLGPRKPGIVPGGRATT
jgi:PAS domain S-box-containing protein